MNNSLILLFFISSFSFASSDINNATKVALEFNQWYLQQIEKDVYPLLGSGSPEMNEYVTAETLRKLHKAVNSDDELYDADFFTRSQDIGTDWPKNVTVVSSDLDPVCLNVYVAYGKDMSHTIIDCMVKEEGKWKIQSVAQQAIVPSENLK
ncbi:DUF3828 domain-containing protein [Hafnia alvei]|uniref:DUF3828 domain-containing protein n=1 Tax=Hafnia alvei TaxID=569 RepID=A0A1C6Z524_HAFAL|nr:DUF3828 domain-containing protein [Hafnia alvei]NLS53741.1 DUF3828 domain-containing protein [Hafnia alvei]SCM54270.1 Protein of unknown function (DUF3828) [Hafnia alvei]